MPMAMRIPCLEAGFGSGQKAGDEVDIAMRRSTYAVAQVIAA